MEVYDKLRNELLDDPLLPDAPKAAVDWLHEVGGGTRCNRHGLLSHHCQPGLLPLNPPRS